MSIKYKTIGIIHTTVKTKQGMPIQPGGASGIKGTIEIKKKYSEGLKDLDGFSHIILIYHFHKSKGFRLQVVPFLDTELHGVFSTRAPRRPNSIGISVVKLLNVSENILEVENVDILDGTPLLDIKPFTTHFDHFSTEKNGWLDKASGNVNKVKSDARFK